jgi:C_GCAxxG_C_C family probable redox protein
MKKDKQLCVSELTNVMEQNAQAHFNNGYCCSEALFLSVIETFSKEDLGKAGELVSMASGFCGGMGNKKATCGVFTGGALALGFLSRNASPTPTQRKKTRKLSAQYLERLEKNTGAHVCHELLDEKGLFNRKAKFCQKLTCQGAEVLAELIQENQLVRTPLSPVD